MKVTAELLEEIKILAEKNHGKSTLIAKDLGMSKINFYRLRKDYDSIQTIIDEARFNWQLTRD